MKFHDDYFIMGFCSIVFSAFFAASLVRAAHFGRVPS